MLCVQVARDALELWRQARGVVVARELRRRARRVVLSGPPPLVELGSDRHRVPRDAHAQSLSLVFFSLFFFFFKERERERERGSAPPF